jgi:peptidyl-prolyl cis-trans isomerase C
MRFDCRIFIIAAVALSAAPALAQTAPATPPAAPAAQAPAADPVVARVGPEDIHLSDISAAAQGLPAQYHNMSSQALYPLLLDQAIDRNALVAYARSKGIDKDTAVQHAMQIAANQVLADELMRREVAPQLTEAAIRARYDQTVANKPGEEEVHARHILVANEVDAVKIIAELKKGADFAAIAKSRSTDPGAKDGGDLGFFKKGDMLPEFAEAAFALKPGQISDKPVKTQYGWHVIKLEERRAAPPPTYAEVHDELRQQLIQEDVQKVLVDARSGLKVEKFNADGSAIRATDTAQPPPAPTPPAQTKP